MARAVSSGKPMRRAISAPCSHRIRTSCLAPRCPFFPTARKCLSLDHAAPSRLTLWAVYLMTSESRLQSTTLKFLLTAKSSAPKRLVTLEALLEHPVSLSKSA